MESKSATAQIVRTLNSLVRRSDDEGMPFLADMIRMAESEAQLEAAK